VQAQAAGGTNVTEALDKITDTLAGVALRTMPENREHSGISAYSNPLGDYKDPKPPLKCEMHWCGYPLTIETLTPWEVAALNSLVPGAYTVTKGNGNQIPFTVEGRTNMNGKLERLEVRFPCKAEHSTDHRSMTDYIREAMGETVPSLSDLMDEVRRLREENATLHEVVRA
jgi:hypothetical protein